MMTPDQIPGPDTGTVLPMKYERHDEYDSQRAGLAESAFLTLWASLESWHQELVLIGGLAPKYLCGDLSVQRELPRPATPDVDPGMHASVRWGRFWR